MVNSEKIVQVLRNYVGDSGVTPHNNLFVFSEGDIVNYDQEKWQMQDHDSKFQKGDVIKFGTRLDEASPRKLDAKLLYSIFQDVLDFNDLGWK